MQSKWESFLESSSNTASAFVISWLIQAFVVPFIWPSVTASPQEALGIVLLFTIVAVIRNYVWRRLFNKRVVERASRKHVQN